jgi:hypothetical protein
MPPVVYYDCPRCLTKGHVDQNDIIRLKREGIWIPGPCAYCAGNGQVTSPILNNVNPDDVNLVSGMTEEERNAYINNPIASSENTAITQSIDAPASTSSNGSSNLLIGLGMIVLGLIITGVSYSSASSGSGGGHYVITTGLFVVGVIRIFKGLIG